MANSSGKNTRSQGAKRLGNAQQQGANKSSGARRLGPQQSAPARSSGAQRRQARAQAQRTKKIGWIAVGVVVVVVVALIIVKVTSSSSPTSATADAAGDHPALAPAAMVNPVTTVPTSVFNRIGVNAQRAAFVVTKKQPALTIGGKPRVVYVGAEYCPYCAAMRWSMVAAMSRFGTFKGLKETSSDAAEGNIPTFSFLGSTYTSKYFTFSPYEEEDRNQNPLQPVPADVQKLYTTYDGSGASGTIYSPGGAGIPFLDFGNRFVSSGDPSYLAAYWNNGTGPLENGGPGAIGIADAVHNPFSAVGTAISASNFIVMANYISSAICSIDGNQPSKVCSSPGVVAAAKALKGVTPVG